MSVTTGTTPATAAPAISEDAPRPGMRPARSASGLSIAGAGALIFAGFVAAPWEGSSATIAKMRTYFAHPMQVQIAAVLLHFGYLLLIPAAFALAWLARRGARRLSTIGLALAVLGAGLSGIVITDFFALAMAQQLPLQVAARVFDSTSHYGLGFGLIGMTSNFGTVLGLVLLAVAAWRAGWVSWVPAVMILAGFIAVVVSLNHTLLVGGVGSGLVFIGLALLGARVLRASDEEWEDGRPA